MTSPLYILCTPGARIRSSCSSWRYGNINVSRPGEAVLHMLLSILDSIPNNDGGYSTGPGATSS